MRRSERVFYDLNESNEFVEILNSRFYFSSSFNKKRFLEGYESYIKEEENKIIAKYKIPISLRFYLLMCYYIRIEKRGFLIKKYSTYSNDYDIIVDKNNVVFTEIEV